MYSLGFYVATATQAFGILLFTIIYWFSKRNLRLSLISTILVITFLQVAWIINYRIDNYVPTFTISVPVDYQGIVYLFLTNEPHSNIEVNEHGIGYIGCNGQTKLNVVHGSIITKHIEFGFNEISIMDTAAAQLFSYEVLCFSTFDLTEMKPTQKAIDFKCIENDEFARIIEANFVNVELLRRKVWKGREGSWELDTVNARL